MTGKKIKQTDSAGLRRRAEERLGEKAGTLWAAETAEDPLKLLHELQVHRIELEMQNAELRQTRADEARALEKYTDLYDLAPVGYVTLDRNGTILDANLTCCTLMGVARSRLIGRRLELFVAVNVRPAFAEFLRKTLTSPVKESCEVELLKEGKAGPPVQIEGVAVEPDKECLLVLIDVTERNLAAEAVRLANDAAEVLRRANRDAEKLSREKEAAELLRQANMKAEALIREQAVAESLYLAREKAQKIQLLKEATLELRLAKESAEAMARTRNQFFANMSHELRTPMTGILGMVQLALDENLAPAPREYLETALSSARSLLRVLNDILDMSRIEAGKLSIEEKPFFLRKFISEEIAIMVPEARRKGLDLTVSVAEETPDSVSGDQGRLRQVLLNLIGNAVKFTMAGKVAVQVAAGSTTSDGKREITFAIKDTGIGIPGDKKDLLFQAFSQIDASHNRVYGGTGLGLAICREIVELMGGTITFESNEGGGSTFSFTIPLAEVPAECEAEAAVPPPAVEKVTVREDERIPRLLLAEDDAVNRQVLGLMFRRYNYELDSAENGLKAVEMWEKGGYDLVLMDVQMPLLNGFEATRVIREKERERGGHTPIVAITAHAGREDEELCLAAGMDAFVSKPIDFQECLRLIEQFIRKKSGVESGSPQLLTGTVPDIARYGQDEAELRRLNADLGARNAELESSSLDLEAFNYMASHELCKPLNNVYTSAQAIDLLCADQLCAECKEFLQIIKRGAMNMRNLINMFLMFSKAEHTELQAKTADLSEMARAVTADLRLTEPARPVTVKIEQGLKVKGDPELLRVVLENLLNNAWKFTGNMEQATIEFGIEEMDGRKTFFVRDNGQGFDMRDAAKLFLPFQRLPGSEEYTGHGIGLATVERIIRRHGGEIWAVGEPGKGAAFFFTLDKCV